jgi:hypothetical protein
VLKSRTLYAEALVASRASFVRKIRALFAVLALLDVRLIVARIVSFVLVASARFAVLTLFSVEAPVAAGRTIGADLASALRKYSETTRHCFRIIHAASCKFSASAFYLLPPTRYI